MRITLVDVINKCDTNIDTECLIETFKNMILFSDVENEHSLGLNPSLGYEKVTLEDIPEPKLNTSKYDGKTHERYNFKFKGYELEITWIPSDKKIGYVRFDVPSTSINRSKGSYLFFEDGTNLFF